MVYNKDCFTVCKKPCALHSIKLNRSHQSFFEHTCTCYFLHSWMLLILAYGLRLLEYFSIKINDILFMFSTVFVMHVYVKSGFFFMLIIYHDIECILIPGVKFYLS